MTSFLGWFKVPPPQLVQEFGLHFFNLSLIQNPMDSAVHTREWGNILLMAWWPCVIFSHSFISHHALSYPLHSSYVHRLSFSNICSFLSYRFYKWCSLFLESFPYHFIPSLAFQPPPPSWHHSHIILYFLSQCQSLLVTRYWSVMCLVLAPLLVSWGQRPCILCLHLFSGPGTENTLNKYLLNECPIPILRSLGIILRTLKETPKL